MPNTPVQFPNIDLPGAEFFSLAPNGTIAIQGRRRKIVNTGSLSTPPGFGNIFTEANAAPGSSILEDPFLATSGIYLHKADLIISPQDFSGQLQILSANFGFRSYQAAGPAASYSIGTPLLTFTLPNEIEQPAVTDRDLLITMRDIQLYDSGSLGGTQGKLTAAFAIALKNLDNAAAHSIIISARYIYTRLDGLTE